MGKKKNSYEKKAHRKHMLNGTEAHSGSRAPGVVKRAITDLGLGLLGAATGAVVGRASLLGGMVVTVTASYFQNRPALAFGVGMMATGGYQASQLSGSGVNGIDGIKERLIAFKDNVKHGLFLDKIIKSKKNSAGGEESTNGMGEVQYFNYPNKELEGAPLNFNALDHIEKQIAQSAETHAQKHHIPVHDDDVKGIEDHIF